MFLDDFDGDMVCSKLLYHEALGRFDEPKSWEIREINEIMNQSVSGWIPYPTPEATRSMVSSEVGCVETNQRKQTAIPLLSFGN